MDVKDFFRKIARHGIEDTIGDGDIHSRPEISHDDNHRVYGCADGRGEYNTTAKRISGCNTENKLGVDCGTE